jgi:hypothetical protein
VGVVASMKVVSAADFERHADDLGELSVPKDAPSFWLDKAWSEFYFAFRSLSSPLRLTICGDRLVAGPRFFEGGTEDEEGDDYYCAYASPSLVAEANDALAELPKDDVIDAIRRTAGWTLDAWDLEYYLECLDELRAAYRVAAESGGALLISIA